MKGAQIRALAHACIPRTHARCTGCRQLPPRTGGRREGPLNCAAQPSSIVHHWQRRRHVSMQTKARQRGACADEHMAARTTCNGWNTYIGFVDAGLCSASSAHHVFPLYFRRCCFQYGAKRIVVRYACRARLHCVFWNHKTRKRRVLRKKVLHLHTDKSACAHRVTNNYDNDHLSGRQSIIVLFVLLPF